MYNNSLYFNSNLCKSEKSPEGSGQVVVNIDLLRLVKIHSNSRRCFFSLSALICENLLAAGKSASI